jgi:hypothetical protein
VLTNIDVPYLLLQGSKSEMKKKLLLFLFFLAIAIIGFSFGGLLHFGVAAAGTNVVGMITLSTTWTKANSPYTSTGPVAVNTGVTLTIEPGVSVNLNNFYIQINGTLIANGSSTDRISFSNGQITFASVSVSWNETTGSGCMIENAVLDETEISSSNPLKVSKCTTNRSITAGNSSVISYNNITNSVNVGDASVVTNNIINGALSGGRSVTVTNNTVTYASSSRGAKALSVDEGSLVLNNNVSDEIDFEKSTILNNTVNGQIIGYYSGNISYNTVSGNFDPIEVHAGTFVISYNIIHHPGSNGYAIWGTDVGVGRSFAQ